MTNLDRLRELDEYGDVIIFENMDFPNALIGISSDDRAIYDFDLMVRDAMDELKCSETEAIEFIEYNTLRALPYAGPRGPIVMYNMESLTL